MNSRRDERVRALRGRGASNGEVVGDARRPLGQQQHVVGEVHRLLQVVRDEQHGHAARDEDLLQLVAHEERHLVVERGKGLVQEQHLGVDHQRAHDRHQLLLAAGHLVRVAVEVELARRSSPPAPPRRVAARALEASCTAADSGCCRSPASRGTAPRGSSGTRSRCGSRATSCRRTGSRRRRRRDAGHHVDQRATCRSRSARTPR